MFLAHFYHLLICQTHWFVWSSLSQWKPNVWDQYLLQGGLADFLVVEEHSDKEFGVRNVISSLLFTSGKIIGTLYNKNLCNTIIYQHKKQNVLFITKVLMVFTINCDKITCYISYCIFVSLKHFAFTSVQPIVCITDENSQILQVLNKTGTHVSNTT